MKIIPVLIALNVAFGAVATPVFIAGVGLGSGTAGSSYSQKTRLLGNPEQLEAALLIFQHSCDKTEWENKTKQAYPDNEEKLKSIISIVQTSNQNSLPLEMSDGPCQPLKAGKYGIIHVGGNGVEMSHLLSGMWDVRVLDSVAYVLRKRLTEQKLLTASANNNNLLGEKALAATPAQNETAGYQEECISGDKSAPFLTIKTTAGYMDENGQPTAMAKSGDEDDPEAANAVSGAVSPHGRGQAVDFLSVGCTAIKKDGKIEQIIANNLATGQDAHGPSQAPGPELADQMASQSLYQDSGLMKDAAAETLEDHDSLYASGINQAERDGIADVLVAADVVDPDVQPEIIPYDALTENVKKTSDTSLSFRQSVAKFAERVIEQKYSLPSGSLTSGVNLSQIGRSVLYRQSGILLGKSSSAAEVSAATSQIEGVKNPKASLQIPPEAVSLLKKNQTENALNLVAVNRINNQFAQRWSDSQMNEMASSGISSEKFLEILKNDIPIEDPQEEEMLKSLTRGGYEELTSTLTNLQETQDKTPSGSLKKTLQNVNQLNKNQQNKLNDFTLSQYRSGVADRLKALGAPKELIDWVNTHQNLSPDDEKGVKSIISAYNASQNGKETLRNLQGDLFDNIVSASVRLMRPDEQAVYYSIIGANPSSETLRAALTDGRLEKAGEAVVYSRGLQRIGVPSSISTGLAISAASGNMSGTDIGINVLNANFSRYGVVLTKGDLELAKDGQFPGAKKLAIGRIAQKTGISTSTLEDALSKDNKSARDTLTQALVSNSKLSPLAQGVLSGVLAKKTDGGSSLNQNISLAGGGSKAKAISAGISGGEAGQAEAERKQNANKIEAGFSEALNNSGNRAQNEAANLMVEKGLSENDAKGILKGNVKGAESKTAINYVAKQLSNKGYGSQEDIAKVLSNKATPDEKNKMGDVFANNFLSENDISISNTTSVTQTLFKGTNEERQNLAEDIGGQYATNQLLAKARESGIGISLTPQQKKDFSNGDFKALGDVADQTARLEAASRLSDATGGVVSAEVITKAYDSLREDGVLADGVKKDIGWSVMEESFGLSKDAVDNFDSNLKNLPQNYLNSVSTDAINAQLASIGGAIIINNLVGNQLAKMDPTGGLLTSFAMQSASKYILSLGMSVPVLLAISFILDPAATLKTITGMVVMAFALFTDPIGTLMGLFGFGKKKPKLTSTVKNPSNKKKDTIKNPSNYVDTPTKTNSSQMMAFAADNTSDSSKKIQATSDYLPAKKPTKEYIKRVSRRTTDQTVEDLLLMGLANSANRQVADADFIENHWTRYMGSPPQGLSHEVKQLISPRAPVGKAEQEKAQKKGVKDFLYDKENPGGDVGLSFTVDLSRLVFGEDKSPLTNEGRTIGFSISSSVISHIHLSF